MINKQLVKKIFVMMGMMTITGGVFTAIMTILIKPKIENDLSK